MKYLSLNNEEIKELINLKKVSFIGYMIIFGIITFASYFIAARILPDNNDLSPSVIMILFMASYLFIFFYTNRSYFYDLMRKEKRVYRGVLSSKTLKNRDHKYQFHMDGNIFVVDKETFEKFEEGDIVEFHISVRTKHLFKVEKVTESL